MPRLEQILELVSKTDPFTFNYFKDKLDRKSSKFFDNLDVFCDMADVPMSEYKEILNEEHRYFIDNYNGMDLS